VGHEASNEAAQPTALLLTTHVVALTLRLVSAEHARSQLPHDTVVA
jgi:hypothetical protein